MGQTHRFSTNDRLPDYYHVTDYKSENSIHGYGYEQHDKQSVSYSIFRANHSYADSLSSAALHYTHVKLP